MSPLPESILRRLPLLLDVISGLPHQRPRSVGGPLSSVYGLLSVPPPFQRILEPRLQRDRTCPRRARVGRPRLVADHVGVGGRGLQLEAVQSEGCVLVLEVRLQVVPLVLQLQEVVPVVFGRLAEGGVDGLDKVGFLKDKIVTSHCL